MGEYTTVFFFYKLLPADSIGNQTFPFFTTPFVYKNLFQA